jgi:Skp family chaperone for outer membrane proteins
MRLCLGLLIWLGLVCASSAQQLGAPQVPILTVSSERLFAESEFGRRIAREIEDQSTVLAAENRRIEAELAAEEQELTEQRPEMDPSSFRELADAFDTKVQAIRDTQDGKARALAQQSDVAQITFLEAARPVLVALMREAGASVILERASVFLSANASDITDLAITRIDAVLGDGRHLEPDGERSPDP